MKVTIHQPNYLPYFGYFQKMALSDIFVLLDTVQYSKNSYTKRVKIRTQMGGVWLTIPIEKINNFKKIQEIKLPIDIKWKTKHKSSITVNYSKSTFFDKFFVDNYYQLSPENLLDFNEAGIRYFQEKFNIKTKLVRASELKIDKELKSSDLLIEIVKKIGGSTYISGPSGKQYLDREKFLHNNIDVEIFEPTIHTYKQRWSGFEPYMSSIDILFNLGEKNCIQCLNSIKKEYVENREITPPV
jgi:hypothetical protein